MNQPTATGTLTVGGGTVISKTTYVKSGSGTSATYQANLYFGIGLNNFKSITSLFTTYPSGQALSAIVVSFFSLDWQKSEYVYRTVVSGSQTFTPTGIDSSTGTTYTPRWAYISASKEKSASLTTDYIALSSLTFTWNC
jgi:hypothetical protein